MNKISYAKDMMLWCVLAIALMACSTSDADDSQKGKDEKFEFVVRASVEDVVAVRAAYADVGQGSAVEVAWKQTDKLLAVTNIGGKEKSVQLSVVSIDDNKKTATFGATLDFTPTASTQWSFSYASKDAMKAQTGTLAGLSDCDYMTASAVGTSPTIAMKRQVCVLRLELPKGVKSCEVSGGETLEAKAVLSAASGAGQLAYVAFPAKNFAEMTITARNADGDVMRHKILSHDFGSDADRGKVFDISLKKHTQLTAVKLTAVNKELGGNFSGIAWLGGNSYAVVDDKSANDGWWPFTITLTDAGEIDSIARGEFVSSGKANRDVEGIAYNKKSGKIWISGEQDNAIFEYDMSGARTGCSLPTSMFSGIAGNYSFEALTHNAVTGKYWTTTESGLSGDGGCASPTASLKRNTHRLQSYNEDRSVSGQWLYVTDELEAVSTGRAYAFGVPSLCAMDDGRLIVMEREGFADAVIGEAGFCKVKLYVVDPTAVAAGSVLEKVLLTEIRTSLNVTILPPFVSGDWANYEGMCLGPKLADGSRMLLLVSDSQGNETQSNSLASFTCQDWFLPIVLRESESADK